MMKKLPLLLLAATAFLNAVAQKLPKIQTTAMQAPANIKIDGKATEWGDKFSAFNATSRVYYTLANDKDNLYLIAYIDDKSGITKAIVGGITLTLKPANGVKSTQKDVVISFPEGRGQDMESILDLLHLADNYKMDKKKTDSIKTVMNRTTLRSFKEIVVSGVQEVSDRSIPIYNALGIQATCMFDNELKYVYEMALPLKYLNELTDGAGKIHYNIKLNGTTAPKPGKAVLMFSNPAKLDPESQYRLYSTDFNGEYVLAK